jgi:hypothetical protein
MSIHKERRTGLSLALVASMLVPLAGTAKAAHVESVSVTPGPTALTPDTCEPLVVQTTGGSDPSDALVDVEVRSTEIVLNETAADVGFCDPTAPGVVNPATLDPRTGDLGPGPVELDGTIGGEGTTAPNPTVLGDGIFTFGIRSPVASEFNVLAFVEEGEGNDDAEPGEPSSGTGGGGGTGDPVEGAAESVVAVDCSPETDVHPGGTAHNFTCTALDAGDAGVAGALMAFDVIEGPNTQEIETTSCGVTDTDGRARCSYTDATGSGSSPGTDTVVGFVDLNAADPGPEVGAPRDRIDARFLGAGATTKRVKTTLSIKRKFNGRARTEMRMCKRTRKVVLKKVKAGPDRKAGADKTSRKGSYKIRKPNAKGRFYTKTKRKEIVKRGDIINCTGDKSKIVRKRRR